MVQVGCQVLEGWGNAEVGAGEAAGEFSDEFLAGVLRGVTFAKRSP